ncbi:MAG: hypothetical protein JOZ49_10125 [Mycolicibacterium sp.]|jgi:hypothetical protein|nr:hypothetical protein [Mycolicibacterium sp.]
MTDDIDITELERLLFPDGKRPSEMTAKDYDALSATLKSLTEQYGKDRISAMLRELTDISGRQMRLHWERRFGD